MGFRDEKIILAPGSLTVSGKEEWASWQSSLCQEGTDSLGTTKGRSLLSLGGVVCMGVISP